MGVQRYRVVSSCRHRMASSSNKVHVESDISLENVGCIQSAEAYSRRVKRLGMTLVGKDLTTTILRLREALDRNSPWYGLPSAAADDDEAFNPQKGMTMGGSRTTHRRLEGT